MAAPRGTKPWKVRAKQGLRIFDSPDELWEACCDYFDWVEKNPLKEEKVFPYQGSVVKTTVAKMRAMTIEGLTMFLDIRRATWYDWRQNEELKDVVAKVEDIIREQKFTGAAAELLNHAIIARDLGLKESFDHSSADGSMTPKGTTINTTDPIEAAKEYQKLMG